MPHLDYGIFIQMSSLSTTGTREGLPGMRTTRDPPPGWRVRHPGFRRDIANSYRESTPSEKRAGARSYARAGRDAVRVGLGMNPGKQPYEDVSRRPGHMPLRKATPEQRAAFNDPVQREAARMRGAGAIAALSASSPAGMDRENNPTAAHEVWSLTMAHVAKLEGAVDAADRRSKARGALRAAKNRGVGVPEAQAVVDKAEAASRDSSAKARAFCPGHHWQPDLHEPPPRREPGHYPGVPDLVRREDARPGSADGGQDGSLLQGHRGRH